MILGYLQVCSGYIGHGHVGCLLGCASYYCCDSHPDLPGSMSVDGESWHRQWLVDEAVDQKTLQR